MGSILQSGREGLIRETKIPMQELELKMEEGLMHEWGGVIAGFYGITCNYHETTKSWHERYVSMINTTFSQSGSKIQFERSKISKISWKGEHALRSP